MTDYTDLIDQLREPGDEVYSARKKWLIADAIEALVKERGSFYMDYRMKCDVETKRLETELAALRANADRYELMRDMKLYEMQQYRCLPVPMEEAYDWFDAQIDAKIRERYPNAEIGG